MAEQIDVADQLYLDELLCLGRAARCEVGLVTAAAAAYLASQWGMLQGSLCEMDASAYYGS